jgi:hypothetical protein
VLDTFGPVAKFLGELGGRLAPPEVVVRRLWGGSIPVRAAGHFIEYPGVIRPFPGHTAEHRAPMGLARLGVHTFISQSVFERPQRALGAFHALIRRRQLNLGQG